VVSLEQDGTEREGKDEREKKRNRERKEEQGRVVEERRKEKRDRVFLYFSFTISQFTHF